MATDNPIKDPKAHSPLMSMTSTVSSEVMPLAHQLARTLVAVKMLQEKELGVNGLTVMILLELNHKPAGSLTQNYLTNCMRVDPSMITRVVKELEQERGWVRRERDPEDNRLMRVYLTEEGRQQAELLAPRAREIEKRLSASLSETELGEFRRMLSRLEETARRECEDCKEI